MREKGWLRRREPAHPTEGQRRAAKRRLSHEIRSYEASHVHALWHLDFHQEVSRWWIKPDAGIRRLSAP